MAGNGRKGSLVLEPTDGRWAWVGWSFDWDAEPVERTEILCRATDANGDVQPVDQPWNKQGMAHNMAQRVPIRVR